MERQLPKNVRQIGNVSDTPKIYVEDYVDTFLNQMCEKVENEPLGAFLVGETANTDDQDYVYIYGAVQMHSLEILEEEYVISENTWKNAYEDCKQYFEDGEMLGWFVTSPGESTMLHHNLAKLHKSAFPRKNTVMILKEPVEKEETYYVHKFNELLPMGGHYTYYEKNPCMQNYMISCRKKNGVTPSETVEDRAAKDFRSLVRTREELRTQKRTSHLIYAGGALLILLMIVMGISTINNFERMDSVQNALANVTGSDASEDEKKNLTDGQAADAVQEANQQNSDTAGENGSDGQQPNQDAVDSSGGAADGESTEVVSNDISNEETQMPVTIGQEESAAQNEDINGDNGVYIVEAGDTLAMISKKMYGDVNHVDNICNMNGLTDSNLIFIGQKLLIP